MLLRFSTLFVQPIGIEQFFNGPFILNTVMVRTLLLLLLIISPFIDIYNKAEDFASLTRRSKASLVYLHRACYYYYNNHL